LPQRTIRVLLQQWKSYYGRSKARHNGSIVGGRNLGLHCKREYILTEDNVAALFEGADQSSSGELLGDKSTLSCEVYSVFSALHEETDSRALISPHWPTVVSFTLSAFDR